MKKTILAVAMLFATVVSSQGVYVALGGGIADVAGPKVLLASSGLTGSYGEGTQVQLRLGYMATKKVGVELGFGYLSGKDQQIAKSNGLDLVGRGKAVGASLAGVYNLTDNLYMRAGVLTKVAGKTDVDGSLKTYFPTKTGYAPLAIDLSRENKGKFSLGVLAAAGVKFDLGSNFAIFAEMEYQGINVAANKSTLGDFKATLGGQNLPLKTLQETISGNIALVKGGIAQVAASPYPDSVKASETAKLTTKLTELYSLGGLIADDVTYTDNPTSVNERKSTKAPYSSFGLNFGFIYSF